MSALLLVQSKLWQVKDLNILSDIIPDAVIHYFLNYDQKTYRATSFLWNSLQLGHGYYIKYSIYQLKYVSRPQDRLQLHCIPYQVEAITEEWMDQSMNEGINTVWMLAFSELGAKAAVLLVKHTIVFHQSGVWCNVCHAQLICIENYNTPNH